jgi:hypothetical protein
MRVDGTTVILRCDACHADALTCRPCVANGGDE